MNKTLDVILVGAGSRGRGYADLMARNDNFRIVAVADPIPEPRNYVAKLHNIPENMCFTTWEDVLSKPKFADVVIVSTQDQYHHDPAIAAISKGYHLLLEKPIAPTAQECVEIANLAKQKGVKALVCHVLRYTPFFGCLKSLIEKDVIGDVMSIHHLEGVGNVHQSHSYVRGKWGNLERSSPMILAKSCHDMDIIQWLMGQECTKVQSFGCLKHFTRENAPEGAPERCIDGCPHGETCYYNSVKLYLEDEQNKWFREASTGITAPTNAQVEHILRTTQYGKCVYKCDNDVVDHQVVNLEFAGGQTATFTMSAFTRMDRSIRIMGTKGEVWGDMEKNIIHHFDFATRSISQISASETAMGVSHADGHGGGDAGVINALYSYLTGQVGPESLSELGISAKNHMIAFAAEQSRLDGTVITLADFNKELGLL